jgi:DNA polymerase III alpha subunit
MVSRAFVDGFYIKPRIDWPLLHQHSEGLICLSGCVAGAIPRLIRSGDYAGAKAKAEELSALFGPDNFYLELRTTVCRRKRRPPGALSASITRPASPWPSPTTPTI